MRHTSSTFKFIILPFLGRHQSSINPDMGEEWQERTGFVILFQYISEYFFKEFQKYF